LTVTGLAPPNRLLVGTNPVSTIVAVWVEVVTDPLAAVKTCGMREIVVAPTTW